MMKNVIVFSICLFVTGGILGGCNGLCPPEGPWPMPPWCNSSDVSTASEPDTSTTNPFVELATANPYPAENTWGFVTPTPTLEEGSSVQVSFEVALSLVEEAPTLVLNGTNYLMEGEHGYYTLDTPLQTSAGSTLEYYYTDGENQTETRSVRIDSDFVVRDGLSWQAQPLFEIPGFVKGYGMMDFGGFNVSELRGGRLPDTLSSMQNNGAEWYLYDYYWSYTDYSIPEIVDESTFPEMQYPTSADLAQMATEVHDQGMHFILLASLEWSAIPGNPCYEFHDDADKLAECSNNYWLEGREYEVDMLQRLENNPEDLEAKEYRDKWFEQYENFLLAAAQTAEDNQIEMIIIGKNTSFADNPIHESQWRRIIADLRQVYNGEIGLIFECYNDQCLMNQPWVDAVDKAVIFYWFRLSDAESPSYETIAQEMTRIRNQVIRPFYDQYDLPIILMTPFMSRDHSARQEWVEPANSAPGVGLDFQGQADLYQMLFETHIDEPWFNGVVPYGYWFFDGFHVDFAFDRSYNVRNKPAAEVLKSWFSIIEN